MTHDFKIGDAVRVSAAHLRSIDPAAAKGWPSTMDPGKGWIANIVPCGIFELLEIWFYDLERIKTYNSGAIIHDNPNSVYYEAMRAEHAPRR